MAVDWQVYYRVNDDNSGPELLLEVFRERGWLPWEEPQPSNGNEESMNNNSAKFSPASSCTNSRYDDAYSFRNCQITNRKLVNGGSGSNKTAGSNKTHDYIPKNSSEYNASSCRRASCNVNVQMNGAKGAGRGTGYNGPCSAKNNRPADNDMWHLWWKHGFPLSLYTRLRPNQILSHIPKGQGLCRKDSLARALQNMRKTFGAIYDFYPTTFLLPCEYTKLVAEYTKLLHHNTASTCCSSSKSTTPSTTPPSSRRRSGNPNESGTSSLHSRNSSARNSNSRRRSFTQQKSQSDLNIDDLTTSNMDSGYGSTEFNGCQTHASSSIASQDSKIATRNRKARENQCRATTAQHFRGDLSSRYVSEDEKEANVWICKPTTSSQGRGITIFEDVHELKYGDSAVAQRYIERPLLVGGYKCDLRLYVLVTSLSPLTVYLYREGIVRFSTEKYNMAALDRPYCHLTNTSLNKTSPGYKIEKDRVGAGCKWSLRQLRHHLRTSGVPDWLLWQRISCIVSLTLLAHVTKLRTESTLPHGMTNCFELYGFDILVDEKLNPWLLEVNRCPSLSYDCDVDRYVKKPMLHHLFDLLGPPRVVQPIEKLLNPPPKLPQSTKTWGSSVSGSSGEEGECSSYNEESEDETSKENDACSKSSGDKCKLHNSDACEDRKLVQVSGTPKENEALPYDAWTDGKQNKVPHRMRNGKLSRLENVKLSKYKIRKVSSGSFHSNSVRNDISRYSYSVHSDNEQNNLNKCWRNVRDIHGLHNYISQNNADKSHSSRNITSEPKVQEKNLESKTLGKELITTSSSEGVDLHSVSNNDDDNDDEEATERISINTNYVSAEKNRQPSKIRNRSNLASQLDGSPEKNIFPVTSGRISRIREVRFNRKTGRKSAVKRKRTSAHVKCMSITNRLYYNRSSDECWRNVMGNSAKRTHIGDDKNIPLRVNLSKIGVLQSNHRLSPSDGLILGDETSSLPLEITRVSLSPPARSVSSQVKKSPSCHAHRSNPEPETSSRKVPRKLCVGEAQGGRVSKPGQVAEEVSSDTYVPVAFNSSFQRLRRQLLGVAIDTGRSRSSSVASGAHRRRKEDWSLSGAEGGWVRTFPFNTSTAHATKHPLQVRVAVLEVHKYRKLCEKIFTSSKDAQKQDDPRMRTQLDQSSVSQLEHKEENCSDSENIDHSQVQGSLPFCNSKFYYYRMSPSTPSRKKIYTDTSSSASNARNRTEGTTKVDPSSASAEDAAYSAQATPLLWKDQSVWTPGF